MTTQQWVASWIWTGLLGASAMALDQFLRGFVPIGSQSGWAWALFIAWAGYTLAGATLRAGARVVAGYALGIAMSVAILELGGLFAALSFWAAPIAIVIVVSLILSVEEGPELISLSSAMFLSGGTFFAAMGYVPDATYTSVTIMVMMYCILGCMFGALTTAGRTAIARVRASDRVPGDAHSV